MSDIGSGSDYRIGQRPGGLDVARPGARPSGDAGGAAQSRGGRRGDPFNLDAALQRLRTLLAFDGDGGPRTGVPARGFYLNILV